VSWQLFCEISELMTTNREEALVRAAAMYLVPTIPMVMRASLCTYLANGDDDYVEYERGSVELYDEMLREEPEAENLRVLRRNAAEILRQAERDAN